MPKAPRVFHYFICKNLRRGAPLGGTNPVGDASSVNFRIGDGLRHFLSFNSKRSFYFGATSYDKYVPENPSNFCTCDIGVLQC